MLGANAPPAATVRVWPGLCLFFVTHFAEPTDVYLRYHPALQAAGLLCGGIFIYLLIIVLVNLS